MGIGVDLAECFAKDGYDLILTARSEAALKEVATRLSTEYGIKATPVPGDLGTPGGGETLAAEIAKRGLAVDVLVNNAGYGIAGSFEGSDRPSQLGMIDLNDRALAELTHIYWPRMLANKRGGVLNVASLASFQPGPLMAIYYASKAFVLSFSEALWKEAEGSGVHVSCLCPGPTRIDMPGAPVIVGLPRARLRRQRRQRARGDGAALPSSSGKRDRLRHRLDGSPAGFA